jgi:hypothetical protein
MSKKRTDPAAARSKRLWKNYGITPGQYLVMLEEQDGRCKICRTKPKTVNLSVDHDHRVEKSKVYVEKYDEGFIGWSPMVGQVCIHESKKEARAGIKLLLKQTSVRGLLCMRCNRSIQMLKDDPGIFRSAAKYLDEYFDIIGCNPRVVTDATAGTI